MIIPRKENRDLHAEIFPILDRETDVLHQDGITIDVPEVMGPLHFHICIVLNRVDGKLVIELTGLGTIVQNSLHEMSMVAA